MKTIGIITSLLYLTLSGSVFSSARCTEAGITIDMVRAVGDYTSGDQHDNSLELHFQTRNWCEKAACTNKHRVVIDGIQGHLVSAAYMAFASGKTVDITIDDTLPIKSGICSVSIIDVNN